MKKSTFNLSPFELTGLIVGILGAIFFLTAPFASLTAAGHIALAIFWLAACFYMTQPIPVYATSLLVMLFGSLLLTKEGPIYKYAKPEFTIASADSFNHITIPETALFNGNQVFIEEKEKWNSVEVELIENKDGFATISAVKIPKEAKIASQAYHVSSGYTPLSYKSIFGTLADPIIILFLGGFMLAKAAVKYGLDASITATLLKPFGTKPSSILFGLILVTAILSAFMSNTATTAMMMTVILPIIGVMPEKERFRTAVVLSIPIAANIGGIATPIGTPPNAIVVAALAQHKIILSFTDWLAMAGPFTVIMLFVAWVMLNYLYKPTVSSIDLGLKPKFNKEPRAIALYATFALTIGLWFTENLHGIPSGMVAFIPVALLSLGGILTKEDIRTLSWEVLWLVSGGMALGLILDKTGVAQWLIQSIEWNTFSVFGLLLSFALVGIVLSNFLSHTVTATLLMPLGITIGLSGSLGANFSLVIVSMVIGVSTSLAMILPISTPPNAIAVATGLVETGDLAKTGTVIAFVGIPLMILSALFYWTLFI